MSVHPMGPDAPRPIILCVEDEPSLLHDLCEELRAAGYEPVGVPDVERAQNLLSQLTPAMIVCDVNLPGKSGLEFMSELRTGEHLSDVPFMLLTALADREHVLCGKRAGADDYLVKPVDYDMLLASIASRLAQVGRLQASHRTRLRQQSNELLLQWTNVLDKISHCALVCDAALGVRFANRAAYSLCRDGDNSLLSVDDMGQIALNGDIVRHPDVRQFLAGDGEAVKIDISSRTGAPRNWQVSMLALGERSAVTPVRDESFVVFLSDLSQRHLHNRAALARRFSLTPTEMQVASLLIDGLTKQEMCEQLNVSAATTAYHLRNLFSKTDTKRQAELVAMLMSVAWNDIAMPASARH
ncbi:response regulator [Diaphorobacter caeni]|uniref:response regulator n=1 Tax=Diaphorobacter caeni TaxID=2784387 RepID=UPI0018903744|nr:response regulator [Diaphorobacter caeni]MBF5003122.1 response regulator [Diaphorobacter caeni]